MSEYVCSNGHHTYGGDNYEPVHPCEICGDDEWTPITPAVDDKRTSEE